jgi:M6 family metalloprotease-like protein
MVTQQEKAGSTMLPAFFVWGRAPMRRAPVLLFLLSVGVTDLPAQSPSGDLQYCGTPATRSIRAADQEIGGRHITARGTLRILMVFASFPDDDTPNPHWPAHHPPIGMNQFLDPDTLAHPVSTFNLTSYFRRMSLGQFHVIGDVLWVDSHHPSTEYSNNGSYGRANTAVLTEQVDSLVDFTRYDNWTNSGDYLNENRPDSLVDLIVMIWRTQIFPYVGEASLGRLSTLTLDGERIGMGFPEDLAHPVGSGVTCEYRYGDAPETVMRTVVHEIGHWLLGGLHPYNNDVLSGKHDYWGLICDVHRLASCVNTYERERLGWITVPTLRPDTSYVLPDYLSSGAALKYHPVNGSPFEFFYFENHQLQSAFDDVTTNLSDRGLWILHQEGPYAGLDNLRIEPADGDWDWTNPGVTSSCFDAVLPVFQKARSNVLSGPSHRDMIPSLTSDVNWLYVVRGPLGMDQCAQFFAGDSFTGAFTTTGNNIFSPFSNPPSSTWNKLQTGLSLEVAKDSNGVLVIRTFSDSLSSPPARRVLALNPCTPNADHSAIGLAWGAEWPNAQALESDVHHSIVERQVGVNGAWERVYDGGLTTWTDSAFVRDSASSNAVAYRVMVIDDEGNGSTWSAPLALRATALSTGVRIARQQSTAPQIALLENFPNPFNPTTMIRGQWTGGGEVRLVVYDLLGREVAVLANGRYSTGTYTFVFDGTHLASGVYICRLAVGSHTATKAMVLEK